ncbi:MAG: hypothetical protein ACRYG8_16250 [Janthinobacterium lividum]
MLAEGVAAVAPVSNHPLRHDTPKTADGSGERRKRYLFVTINRCSRWVHLAIKDDMTTSSALAFLK